MSDSQLKLATAGDAIINRRLFVATDERFERLVAALEDVDVGVLNLEHPIDDYEGYPAPGGQKGRLYFSGPPWVADELSRMGFNLLSAASNHSWDYTFEGINRTIQELDDRRIPFAGIGTNLAEARAPAYADTSAGRVALISASAMVVPGSEAGIQRPDMHGRPGISPLRVDTRYVLPPTEIEQLKGVSERLGLEALKTQRPASIARVVPKDRDDEEFYFPDVGIDEGHSLVFEEGQEPAIVQSVREDDLEAITAGIRTASRQAEYVVVSVHAHQGPDGSYNVAEVPSFLETTARRCVDAGADAFVSHGPHILRGIEVYDDAPIFYSLGDFILQHHTIAELPADSYTGHGLAPDAPRFQVDLTTSMSDPECWESVLPVCHFEDGDLVQIALQPLELGRERPYPHKGIPRIADEGAERIIETIAARSEPYDTEIEYRDGVGMVNL